MGVPRASEGVSRPTRIDGYAPIGDYAAIGDGRTVALVARDGAIDWLPLPDLDSSPVFAALLDAERGGRFQLAPRAPFEVERRYLSGTNVLETTFTTATGTVRVTDALTLPSGGLTPDRELQRRVECLSGRVPMSWRVEPRFGWRLEAPRVDRRRSVPVASHGRDAIAVCTYDAGDPTCGDGVIEASFDAVEGRDAHLALCAAHQEPLVVPARREVEERLNQTIATWSRWTNGLEYDGPWPDNVLRSILALKLLVAAPSGAVAAAATTSLPEEIGGGRNWDYRYAWVRDSAFTVDAMIEIGCFHEARAYFWWLMHASQLTHPTLRVLYELDGGHRVRERELPLHGYRRSRPVRVGNGAVSQCQLDPYGEVLQTAWLYAETGHRIERDLAHRLAETADEACELWRRPDAGIWESRREPSHHTQSKMMCWIALERAAALAERGIVPDKRLARWRAEQREIREFVETRCWSHRKRSYVAAADTEDLDAAVLLGPLQGYGDPGDERLRTTVDAIRSELGHGPLVRRYASDELGSGEGAFVACSFWVAEALTRGGRLDEAVETMESLLDLANDVGLYSEEIDVDTGAFLGNLPQGLSHLSLISAATAIGAAQ